MGARPKKMQPKSERFTMRVTAEEREAVEGMAEVRECSYSELLRKNNLTEIVAKWRRLREKMQRSGKVMTSDAAGQAAAA